MSLLSEIKKSGKKKMKYILTPEWEEVVIAWLKDEISITQINKGLKKTNSGNVLYALASLTKEMYRLGKIVIK